MYVNDNNGFGDAAPSCASTNCSAVSRDRFDKQPPDLLRVLNRSSNNAATWFANLSDENRFALTSIFNRLCKYGLWCHVLSVLKIDNGEEPVVIADRVFNVPGRTPSVYFMSPSGEALVQAILGTGRFCKAHGIGASQHKGQITLREISASDSLHISVGPGNRFDAHIDKFSPVTEKQGGILCSNSATVAALTHIGRELVPELVRKVTGIPGVQIFPDFETTPAVPRPEPTSRQDAGPPPPLIGITLRGPRKRTVQRPVSNAGPLLPVEVVKKIEQEVRNSISPDALVPAHVLARRAKARRALEFSGPFEEAALRKARDTAEREAASYPDPILLALDLAERMEHARRGRVNWVRLELPQYDFGSRKAIAASIAKIANLIRSHLPERSAIGTIIIIFGSGNAATREEVKLGGIPHAPSLSGLGDAVKKQQLIDRIQYIEAEVTRLQKDGRLTMSYKAKGPMPDDKKTKFIKRFIDPMLKHDLAIDLLLKVNQGNHPVGIAWGNGKIGFNGTIALDREQAIGGQGSPAVIFIDEQAPDLKNLPTLIANPDVLLFHELLHARCTQNGTVVGDEEEMERRVIGIGKYTNTTPTENAYRDAKGLQRRCCWKRETL